MKQYVSLKTAAMKMGKNIFTAIIAMVAKRKKFFMLIYPGHVTLTSWIFFKILPVVCIIEILKS